ncbi:glycosyltransferase family 2 protein [Candidatus Woesearchaeota archaeon]|nr:glycosyltransferase family 2 protein [Candidatus Woesearchaeota archaeon]
MQITFLDAVLFPTYFLLLFLAIFWMLVLFSPEQKPKRELKRKPKFSTIIPVFNEEKSVGGTLESLVNLRYPKELMEIVVVNDGSKDNTQQIVEQFIATHPEDNIKLINQDNHGKGRAMNTGLAHISGEFFACLDADSFIHSNALEAMLPLFADKQVGAVCPLMKVRNPQNTLQKVQWTEYIINMFYRFLNAKINCVHVTPGPFSVYRTKVIKDLGGFYEGTITEDLEIAIRLQSHHYKILQTFDTIVETISPETWKQAFRQRVRWYKGSVDNTIRYKKMLFNKEYGDFGFLRMPAIILSGLIAIVLSIALLQDLLKRVIQYGAYLKEINFDILTLIKNFSPDINLLTLPYFKLLIAGTLIAISLFIMVKAFKLVQEKITNYGRTWVSLITYLLVYSLFLSTVWMYIAYMFVRRKKNFWY